METNANVSAQFIKEKNKSLQFSVGNKPVNVIYGGKFSKTFRKAVRKQFKIKPFSLPQNIKSFAGMGINRSGNIVEFSKVAKKFQHSFKQKFRVYQIIGIDDDDEPILQHHPYQDFKTTLPYITKNGKNTIQTEQDLIQDVIKSFFNKLTGSEDRIVVKPYKKSITKVKPMYHPALPTTIKGKSLIPDSKDVDFNQRWNTKKGSCFYDYLLHRYGTALPNGKWNNKVPKELRILVQDKERFNNILYKFLFCFFISLSIFGNV